MVGFQVKILEASFGQAFFCLSEQILQDFAADETRALRILAIDRMVKLAISCRQEFIGSVPKTPNGDVVMIGR